MEVSMTLDIARHIPLPLLYSFQYMNMDGTTIFRYDNIGYHPGLPHFPHHKHEGADERVVGCPQPSMHDIRDEIEAHLKGLD